MLINEGKSNRKLPKIFVGKNLWMTQKKALQADLIKKASNRKVCTLQHQEVNF